VPGKFEVFARTPQRRLKSVVLPVFGLPSSAMHGARPRRGRSPLRRRHHEELLGQAMREADARRAHLHDAGVPGLADAQQAVLGEPRACRSSHSCRSSSAAARRPRAPRPSSAAGPAAAGARRAGGARRGAHLRSLPGPAAPGSVNLAPSGRRPGLRYRGEETEEGLDRRRRQRPAQQIPLQRSQPRAARNDRCASVSTPSATTRGRGRGRAR